MARSRSFKGWTIEPRNRFGMYVASNVIDGYYRQLVADSRRGIKQLIIESEAVNV